jgi:hypothetical protein
MKGGMKAPKNSSTFGLLSIKPIFYTFRRFEVARSNQINGLEWRRRWNVVPRLL